MKIFFSLNHFLPDRIAGIEVYAFNLAKSLQASGIEVAMLIPLFDGEHDDTYFHENIKVICYPENSINDRNMILGRSVPLGLIHYIKILREEKPDVLHFHEIAAGRGIGLFHLRAVSKLGIKIVLTPHLSTYSCQTGNLVYKEKSICDGIIRTHTCTRCVYQSRGVNALVAPVLQSLSKILYASGIDASRLNSEVGTALGYPFLIDKKKQDLLEISKLCDKIVVYTFWYKKILEANGVPPKKIAYCKQGMIGKANGATSKKSILPLRLIFVGRISKFKGVHILLKALQDIDPGLVNLDIYGPITENHYSKECMLLSSSMNNVKWFGTIKSADVIQTMTNYDLLCLPSTFSEMGPLVIQEAFAAGIPVLASNVYGNAEQITDGLNGWLFHYKSASSLKNTLLYLIQNPQKIDEAKKNIPSTRTYEDMAQQYLELYGSVLSIKADNSSIA